jgi:hypothetical protein
VTPNNWVECDICGGDYPESIGECPECAYQDKQPIRKMRDYD